jgi:hypothetical protein
MQKLVATTPALAERSEFQRIMNLKGLDVIATRCVQLRVQHVEADQRVS